MAQNDPFGAQNDSAPVILNEAERSEGSRFHRKVASTNLPADSSNAGQGDSSLIAQNDTLGAQSDSAPVILNEAERSEGSRLHRKVASTNLPADSSNAGQGDSSLIAQNDRLGTQNDRWAAQNDKAGDQNDILNNNQTGYRLTASRTSSDESAIQVGHLFLMPWKRLSRGKTSPTYPQRLGPLARRSDNGLAAVVENYTLYQWGSNLSESESAFWRDFANSEEGIEALSQSQHGSFVGTDSGLVAIVKADGSQDLVERAHTEDGSFDSRNGVLTNAVAADAGLAVVGTLRGQIKLYDLSVRKGAPKFITDAHEREIVATDISCTGQLIATTSADGVLKLWKVHSDRLELLFELTSVRTPAIRLQFSRDGEYLYVLRTGERGVRRIDLNHLEKLLSSTGIGWR
jgi:hypothetical protein